MEQSTVKIVYPIAGSAYPIVEADSLAASAYITASFSITLAGGPHKVKWGFDKELVGNAIFYDQFSAQFVWNLAAGEHTFSVASEDGSKELVQFEVA
ncbi:MAG: hypothetical protein Q3M24_18715 [Candidatus Electrothrix aestuarii]|uniref:Penicillin-binding C-terminal domain-containing protein n=1 Tax=Candidatus Electrothrix aestuarii TaxID=3062594 RepID=A0AAU8LTQ9_9BACT|nr:hypothetical protein [Candidatus Electrothrix aestuarii]